MKALTLFVMMSLLSLSLYGYESVTVYSSNTNQNKCTESHPCTVSSCDLCDSICNKCTQSVPTKCQYNNSIDVEDIHKGYASHSANGTATCSCGTKSTCSVTKDTTTSSVTVTNTNAQNTGTTISKTFTSCEGCTKYCNQCSRNGVSSCTLQGTSSLVGGTINVDVTNYNCTCNSAGNCNVKITY